ncbi:MAG: hypothetical protein AAGM22_25350 [Acidobacteriota bacterium]
MTGNDSDSNATHAGLPPGFLRLLHLGARSAVARPLSSFLLIPTVAAVAVGGCLVPLVNFAFLLVGLAPMAGALPAIALAIARGDASPAGRWRDGFRHFERCLGLLWVPYLFAAGASIPFLIALWADRRVFYNDAHPALFAIAGALSLALLLGPLHRYVLAPFAVFDVERGVPFPEVLEFAAQPMGRHRVSILVRVAGLALFGLGGAALFGVGAAVTAPWALVSAAHRYLHLRPTTAPTSPAPGSGSSR